MSRWPGVKDARDMANRMGCDAVIILGVHGGRTGGASYGQTKAQCASTGKVLDEIVEAINDGLIGSSGEAFASDPDLLTAAMRIVTAVAILEPPTFCTFCNALMEEDKVHGPGCAWIAARRLAEKLNPSK